MTYTESVGAVTVVKALVKDHQIMIATNVNVRLIHNEQYTALT